MRGLASALRDKHPHIDLLANNAGGTSGSRQHTVDGFELTIQSNLALIGDYEGATAQLNRAMERSLADAGSPPRLADTPAEVLGRATASGLVRSAWASTLTGLFRRARYSSHPMTEADREEGWRLVERWRESHPRGTRR